MRYSLKQELKEARPNLESVSPMSFWFIILMGIFNLTLGLSFALALEGQELDSTLNTFTAVVPIGVWAVLFSGLGFIKLLSIVRNNWRMARRSLLAGVALKSGWAIVLIARTLSMPDNIFLTSTWVTIAIVQVLCYIYFLPPSEPRTLSGEALDD